MEIIDFFWGSDEEKEAKPVKRSSSALREETKQLQYLADVRFGNIHKDDKEKYKVYNETIDYLDKCIDAQKKAVASRRSNAAVSHLMKIRNHSLISPY